MQIQINASDVKSSDAIATHVVERIEAAIGRWADHVTRVEVHLHDVNGHKSGVDKSCKMEVRLKHHQPLAVEDIADDLYEAVRGAAKKLSTRVQRTLEKLNRT
jgi:ribosomal subunit interface protein